MDLTGRTLLGKYEIEGLLGQGGMGAVWRARHALTGRKLAIKTLDEAYLDNKAVVQRFGREARAASACQHPGIVEVLDLDQTEDGVPFLVMEFLEGETLARRIERRGRLQQDEIVHLGKLLLEALAAAHAQGVVHRDLKPENIHVVPAGRRGEIVKILDFGISHKRDEAAAKLTMTGSVLGTPHYMSPEQAMGETEIDQRADLYAAGVVLYECAVGDVPFDAPNYNKLLRTILDQQPVPPRRRGAQITEPIERVIAWAMEKERDRRIPSARAMIEWLDRAAAGEEVPYTPVAPQARASSSSQSLPAQPAGSLPYKPAGTLPLRAGGLAPTLGDGEASDSWRPAPPPSTPPARATPPRATPPRTTPRSQPPAPRSTPSSFDDLELDLPSRPPPRSTPPSADDLELALPSHPPAAPSVPPAAGLELDEDALRTRSIPPAASSPGTIASPASATRTGSHSIPPRLSEMSGRYAPAAPPPEPEPPAWRRYALVSFLAVAGFVGLVFAVRWIVEPGVPEQPVEPPVAEPAPTKIDRTPVEPAWVSVTVEGLPPGTRMLLDGLPASSPFRVPRGGEHVVEITAPGYEPRRIEVSADRNRTLRANLRPAVQ